MTITKKKTAAPAYFAPDCEACGVLTGAIICQSGETEDWVYDEDPIV